jgi:putative flippase GtrA
VDVGHVWRFATIGTVAAVVQLVLLWLLVDGAGLHYLLGAALAIECTIVLQYGLNNAWTFRESRHTGAAQYVVGLVKTNLVRGTALPIQVALLFGIVELFGLPYLVANAVAIAISGVYRFALDISWTWG